MPESSQKEKIRKRVVVVSKIGQVHIKATYNNLIICMTNQRGDTISWSSGGKVGYKGAKKKTPYVAQISASDCAKFAHALGLRKVEVYLKGPGTGGYSAVTAIQNSGVEIGNVSYVTNLPHNGCRPPKCRRP